MIGTGAAAPSRSTRGAGDQDRCGRTSAARRSICAGLSKSAVSRIIPAPAVATSRSPCTQASGIEFGRYLSEAVLEPLGMTATRLDGGAQTAGYGATSTVADLAAFAGDLLCPMTVSAEMHAEATTVQFPGLDGVLPGYGVQRPNDWGLGFEIRDSKSPHWTGAHNSPGSYGHFGQSGTLIWADPRAKLALVVLTDRDFGDWALPLWPDLSDSVLAAYNSD